MNRRLKISADTPRKVTNEGINHGKWYVRIVFEDDHENSVATKFCETRKEAVAWAQEYLQRNRRINICQSHLESPQ